MVSLRDPLRDTLEFKKFAWGSAIGCLVLILPVFRAFQVRNFSRWVYTPVLLAFALFIALIVLGSGPTGSDAKVNLGPFQPVEVELSSGQVFSITHPENVMVLKNTLVVTDPEEDTVQWTSLVHINAVRKRQSRRR